MKNAGKFLIKSFAFSMIFIFCAVLFLGLIGFPPRSTTSRTAASQSVKYDQLLRESSEQQQRATEYMARSQALMDRQEKLLDLEEKNAKRQAAVIEALEKQAKIK